VMPYVYRRYCGVVLTFFISHNLLMTELCWSPKKGIDLNLSLKVVYHESWQMFQPLLTIKNLFLIMPSACKLSEVKTKNILA
jgi:hypothetical protein